MKSGCEVVQRRNGATVIDVQCPSDIVLYQKNMGGVDRGDQHRVIGAGFANVAHFKKWFKRPSSELPTSVYFKPLQLGICLLTRSQRIGEETRKSGERRL